MTICVNAAASGANNGGCWTDAYTSLQTALSAAGNGDEVWVAAATYKPTATADRTISFALGNGVGVYGGFAGTETMRSQRNPSAHVTILSGDIGTVGNASDNSFHVVTSDSSVTATGVLDGFTITAGNANGSSASNQDRGGGLWINGGSVTISHCIFTGNSASEKGGGIRVTSASPTIDHCTFTSNSGGQGGGGIGAGSGSGFTVSNSTFRSNSTVSTSGAGLETASGVTAVNCVFQNNSGNGLLYILGGIVINSTFTGNTSYGVAFDQDGTVVNSILWVDAIDEVFVGFGTINITYSDVGGSGFSGTGNKNANPLFVNAGTGDLRLGSGSPAVDAGNNAGVPGGITTDLNGLPRFFDDPSVPDTGAGSPPIVDMGAYERVPLSVSSPSSATACSGSSASFSVTASGQPTLTYRWRKGGVVLSDGGAVSGSTTAMLTINPVSAGDAGSYDVVVTDGFEQNVTSSAATLTVKSTPSAPTAGNNGPISAGQTLNLTASTITGATYSWTGPNGFSSSLQNPTIPDATPAASGIYSVTVTVNGCTSAAATTVASVLGLSRDFVSAKVGSDVNTCGLASACRTFNRALSFLAAGAELIVLDSGGYGPFVVSRAVSVVVPMGVYAGITASSGDAVTVSADVSDLVTLRGLTINSQGGTNGIRFVSGGELDVESCSVIGFSDGIRAEGPGGLSIRDTQLRNATSEAVHLLPPSPAQAALLRCRIEDSGSGLSLSAAGSASLVDSVVSGNSGSAISCSAGEISVADCLITGNGTGAAASGTGTVRISDSCVTDNTTGLAQSGSGTLLSRGDNTVEGNGANHTGSVSSYPPK
jgi:predicted outer membrane repeat protein